MPELNSVSEGYQLSPQQRHLWRVQNGSESAPYHVWALMTLLGPLDVALLKEALNRCTGDCQILRTAFHLQKGTGTPLQLIHPNGEPDLVFQDLSHLAVEAAEVKSTELLTQLAAAPFDLANNPLLRCTLIRFSNTQHRLGICLPALCADEQTLKVLIQRIANVYRALVQQDSWEEEEAAPYVMVAQWQNELLASPDEKEGRDLWRRKRLWEISPHYLACRKSPSVNHRFKTGSLEFDLDSGLVNRLSQLAKVRGASERALYLACWQTLLWRLLNESRVLLGLACNGRVEEDLQDALGPLTKFLPVLFRGEPSLSFSEVLERAEEALTEAEQWQECFSWDDALTPNEVPATRPFFPLCLAFSNYTKGTFAHGINYAVQQQSACIDRFELKLTVVMDEHRPHLQFHYDPSCYRTRDVSRLAKWYHHFLNNVTELQSQTIETFEILTDWETRQLLHGFNAEPLPLPSSAGIHTLFETQTAQTPQRIATVCGLRQWTYAHLNQRAQQIAKILKTCGAKPESLVGIIADRSDHCIAAILGVLKSGAAFVPLAPEPPERLTALLEESKIELLLSPTPETAPQTTKAIRVIPFVRKPDPERSSYPISKGEKVISSQLAYVLHTSGSTGSPKGSMITHQSVVNLFRALQQRIYNPWSKQPRRIAINGPLTFDTSVKQWVQLLGGHSLITLPENVRLETKLFASHLRRHRVDVLDCTPSHLELFEDVHITKIKGGPSLVLVGGEAVDQRLYNRMLEAPDITYFNLYGPTECTVDTTAWRVQHQSEGPSLGDDLANLRTFVVDDGLQLLPIGFPGQLTIAGTGLARGYWSDPALTATRFIPNPYSENPGDRLYQTGDIASRWESGQLAFLGRSGKQVKIRGHRIEPKEMETALESHPQVRKGIVLAHEDELRGTQLIAYAVPHQKWSPSFGGLPRHPLPNGLAIAHLNQNETDFLYREMFEIQAYLKGGITLEKGDTIFDVGANIGMFSLFAHLKAEDVNLYSFEPNPAAFSRLHLNTTHYQVNATLFPCGLSDKATTAELTYYPEFSILSGLHAHLDDDRQVVHSYIQQQNDLHGAEPLPGEESFHEGLRELVEQRLQGESVQVNLTTLSQVMASYKVENIDLLKINVEKSEHQVLAGIQACDWPKIQQIAMELHDIDGRLAQVTDLLRNRGYHLSVEKDWSLKQSAETNYYLFARRSPPIQQSREVPPRVMETAAQSPILTPRELRQYLSGKLPNYMQPAHVAVLENLPLNANGKLDTEALPCLDEIKAADRQTARPPRSRMEQRIAAIWRDVLQLQQVDVQRRFFELGGDSLLLVRVKSELKGKLGTDIPVADLFKYPTVASLAKYLEQTTDATTKKHNIGGGRGAKRRQAAANRGRRVKRTKGTAASDTSSSQPHTKENS